MKKHLPETTNTEEEKISEENLSDLIKDSEVVEEKISVMAKKLSSKTFILSIIFILILGLSFAGGLYYILNMQFQVPKLYSPTGTPVTSAPKSLRIDLQQPDDDALSFESSVLVSGKTAPFLDILIFTNTKDLIIKSKADGNFSTVVNLDEGVNKLNIVVFDRSGESRSTQRTVYFSKEKI